MSIVITAASGRLGRLAVLAVLDRDVDPADVVAGARDLAKVADLAERGVRTAVIDYDEPATVEKAVSQGDTLALVSGTDLTNRDRQHAEVIAAATKAGAARIVYTSGLKADDTPLPIAAMHLPTEQVVRASGVPFTILRNGWYSENYARDIPTARETGVLLSSTGEGVVASASRQDLAEAIAVVATSDGHEGKTYELSGDTAWNYDELAAALSEVLGREVIHRNVSTEEHRAILAGAGVPEQFVEMGVAVDAGLGAGAMGFRNGDLSRLIGRRTTPLVETLRTLV
ncbi:NAD(P)-dependent oxidoreductase [Nocardia nova]|uniref:NAD(P)-dependent oxidoreductase n=1 Tax=Nocardia nova TaxID=37330 RepID=A0A2S6AJC4_9NOCA|nr:SDR family oxidoreductase [Nocardia nova]PPJ22582.1 NAD(P)-dependent oxidoreductase [Nocardia nova]PPJ35322.1 NAD(P)-dependent oxidoreductase [Nocardia nova]